MANDTTMITLHRYDRVKKKVLRSWKFLYGAVYGTYIRVDNENCEVDWWERSAEFAVKNPDENAWPCNHAHHLTFPDGGAYYFPGCEMKEYSEAIRSEHEKEHQEADDG